MYLMVDKLSHWWLEHWLGTLISMALCKKDLTPLLMHWSYVFLALSHRYTFLWMHSFYIWHKWSLDVWNVRISLTFTKAAKIWHSSCNLMITSMRNGYMLVQWFMVPRPISWRSFSHTLATKNVAHLVCFCFELPTVLVGFCSHLAAKITSKRRCFT